MKTLVGKVMSIEIGVPVEKKDGGTYEAWSLTYRDSSGKVSNISKPIGGLKFQPKLKAALEALQAGDEFTAEMEKNDRGYLEVVSLAKGANLPVQVADPRAPAKEYRTDRSARSDEVQVMIVRQSSLAQAVNALSAGYKGGGLTFEPILALAETFEKWVLRKEPEKVPEVE